MGRPPCVPSLLFDESLPWPTAAELRSRGFDVSWVGDQVHKSPSRGADDREVLAFASDQGRLIVTSDRGLVLACIEQHRSVIWISPYGVDSKRQLKKPAMRRLISKQVHKWAEFVADATDPICIHVLSSGSQALSLDEAALLLQRRKRSRTARERKAPMSREKTPDPLGPLFPSDSDQTPPGPPGSEL